MKYYLLSLFLAFTAQSFLYGDSDNDLQEASSDLLRFTNHDSLRGRFIHYNSNEKVIWKSEHTEKPTTFKTKNIHKIILNKGRAHKVLRRQSTVKLINGDRIVGRLLGANPKSVQIDTDHLGELSLEADLVSTISPNPFSGELLYYGPLDVQDWKTLSSKQTHKQASGKKNTDRNDDGDWKHIVSAWYSGADRARYLVLADKAKDKCRIFFNLAWRGILSFEIAIYADLPAHQEQAVNKRSPRDTEILGNAYVLRLTESNLELYENAFDQDDNLILKRIRPNQGSLNLSQKQEANFEIRMDRAEQEILFYQDGNLVTKWNLQQEHQTKGNAIAFRNINASNSQVRISDIIIAPWNGLQDSAQSMKDKDHDLVLLSNGLDRYSGVFDGIEDEKVHFKGIYNNEMIIPIEQIQEIHLASSKRRTAKMKHNDENKEVHFYSYPLGRVSGHPIQRVNGNTKLQSKLLGELELDTSFIGIIDYTGHNNILDYWDDDF